MAGVGPDGASQGRYSIERMRGPHSPGKAAMELGVVA